MTQLMYFLIVTLCLLPVPVAARSKAARQLRFWVRVPPLA
jgi:hypothetical protein